MTTARNLLFADLSKVLTTKSNETARERILRTLDRYRVQMKPGITLAEGLTAREALFKEVIDSCAMVAPSEIPRRLQGIFDRYRMQAKQKNGVELVEKITDLEPVMPVKKAGKKAKEVVKSKPLTKMEPLGGGPIKRSKARGECPKCHSMGIVLAHSYAGDDYFSCIYCGFQAYKAVIETDLDLPLAAELMGRRFDEKSDIEPEELVENEIP